MVRLKNRYIVVQIVPHKESAGKSFADQGIARTVLKHVQKHFGIVGAAAVEQGFRVKYCNDETKITILRCRHRPHRFVTSILPLINVICDQRAKFRILYIGATIMQCNKFIVAYQNNYLMSKCGKIESKKARMDFIENVMDFEID